MLQIAGGILIAIAVLFALPYILIAACFALICGFGLAIAVALWFVLASVVGAGWAWAISIAAVAIWLCWSGLQEEKEKQAHKVYEDPQEARKEMYRKLLREGYVFHKDVNGRKRIQDWLDSGSI